VLCDPRSDVYDNESMMLHDVTLDPADDPAIPYALQGSAAR
jgi:hypothetical protein